MKKTFKFALGAAALLVAAKGLDNRIEVTYYNVPSPKIPREFDNFKIVHISDYHNDPAPGLISEIKTAHPDIIVMTGDMTHDKGGSYLPALELIKRLVKIAPCYIVSGNHDIWRNDYPEFVSDCRNAGAIFLQNETVPIKQGESEILISGMEDVFSKVRSRQKITQYLKNFSVSEQYQILLFHRANALDCIKDFGFDLILAGHLHGGQVRIPHFGGVCSPLSGMTEDKTILFPKYSGGIYKHKDCTMIVNRGIGNPMPIPRLYNRPEIGIITLHSVKK